MNWINNVKKKWKIWKVFENICPSFSSTTNKWHIHSLAIIDIAVPFNSLPNKIKWGNNTRKTLEPNTIFNTHTKPPTHLKEDLVNDAECESDSTWIFHWIFINQMKIEFKPFELVRLNFLLFVMKKEKLGNPEKKMFYSHWMRVEVL